MLQLRKKTRRRKNTKRTSIHSTMTATMKRALGALGGSLSAQGDRVATALEERLSTVLEEGEVMPDLRLLLRLFERLLGRSSTDLDTIDAEGWKQAQRLRALRFECRKVQAEVHAAAVKIRKVLVELVGSKRCRLQFGLSTRTPRGAEDLAIETRRLISRLGAPELSLPGSLLPGLKADPAGWVAELEPGLGRLEELLRQIERRRIAVSDGVIARQKALDDSGETCRLVTGASVALFALAGEKELARRLRPKRRRRREAARTARSPAAAALRSAAASLLAWLRRVVGGVRSAASELLRRRGRNSEKNAPWRVSARSFSAPKA